MAFVIVVPFISFFLWSVIGVSVFRSIEPYVEKFIHSTDWLSSLSTNLNLITILEYSADVVTALILILLLFPLVVWTSLVFTAAFAMPWILRMLKPMYPNAFRSPTRVSLLSTWKVSLKVFIKVVPLYFILLLLAWIPSVYLIGTFILTAWVNSYFMAVEVLSELTDEATLRNWIKNHRSELFSMGAVTVLMLIVPLLQWIVPVFAGLWIAHYILSSFSRERA